MDPQQRFCPNEACVARGQIGKGNLVIHSKAPERYRCKVCRKTFSGREGTVFYRAHVSAAQMTVVLGLIAHGCPIAAICAVFGYQARTVRRWVQSAGDHCEALHDAQVAQPRILGFIQADELRVKVQKGVLWVAMAVAVPYRLWLGGVESPNRDRKLIRSLFERAKRAAKVGPLLVATDGFSAYPGVIRRVFSEPEPTGRRGRPRLVAWADRMIGQVVKQYEKRRVVAVERRMVEGDPAGLGGRLKRWRGGQVLNTAYIERLNATFRSGLSCLVRKTRHLARRTETLHAGLYLLGTVYNFCTPHQSLSSKDLGGQTPAMAARITDHVWTVREVLEYRVPPPRWKPPKQRGRRSRQIQDLIQQWAT
jgi:transposase-like protein